MHTLPSYINRWSCSLFLYGDYYFSHLPTDVQLLRDISKVASAAHCPFFTGADPGLRVGEGDKLFAHVYLEPKDPPKEIMLQFNDGSWEHRATWGEDVIPWGAANSPSRLPGVSTSRYHGSSGFASSIATCLYAAAWKTTCGAYSSNTCRTSR